MGIDYTPGSPAVAAVMTQNISNMAHARQDVRQEWKLPKE